MRNPLIKHYILLIVLSLFLGSSSFAQKAKKNKEAKSSEEEPTWEEFSNDETTIIDP